MECSFSEFSYGYAAIREAESELAQVYRSRGAPILPSLVAEEQLGWDAQIPFVEYALFLQFKRAQYVSRRHPASPTWPHVGGPHYRFAIDTDGHQHRALLHLEQRLRTGIEIGEVFYAAPTFHEDRQFDACYSTGEVLDRSSLVSPSEFRGDSGVHHFVTDLSGNSQILSTPRAPQRRVSWEGLVAMAQEHAVAAAEGRPRQRMRVGVLEEELMVSAEMLGRGSDRAINVSPIRRIQRLAALLDCGLVLLLSSPE
ncbi:hypothetical protein ACFW0V_22795 [Micromonospora parva]|uniref:hypothetical protein n=1 Tax=Micromonospora parva TaxID=1464048 RepID=UPI00366E8BB6